MRRDLNQLAERVHDLLVVGGGVHGACVAWDASLRGLSVALVERDDFGAATSANSLRIVHGGLRYLARGDLPRMRQSIRERSALLRIAPGLVVPLPVLVPTSGMGSESRLALRAALALNDLASAGRNRGFDRGHHIPAGRLLSHRDTVQLFPPLAGRPVTGGALWYDARIRRPERLTLSFVRSAAERGATAANYLEVERLLTAAGAVHGAQALDRRSGTRLEIRARAVAVAAGPWTDALVAGTTGRPAGSAPRQALAVNLVIGRRLAEVAVGVRASSGPADDPVIGGRRFLFLAPQDGATLLGTWYAVDDGTDPRPTVERGAATLLAEFNAACPGLQLRAADVARVQWGRLPLKAGLEPGRADALADRPRVVDHAAAGTRHLFSVEGVKYTTARGVADEAVDRIVGDLGVRDPGCRTAETVLSGAYDVPPGDPRLEARIGEAVRDEMALTLGDVVFRRTGLGEPPGPTREAVSAAARIAGDELGWDVGRQAAEVEDVMQASEVVA
jgi:glycerol-3-phosphate dehydrogenase